MTDNDGWTTIHVEQDVTGPPEFAGPLGIHTVGEIADFDPEMFSKWPSHGWKLTLRRGWRTLWRRRWQFQWDGEGDR